MGGRHHYDGASRDHGANIQIHLKIFSTVIFYPQNIRGYGLHPLRNHSFFLIVRITEFADESSPVIFTNSIF